MNNKLGEEEFISLKELVLKLKAILDKGVDPSFPLDSPINLRKMLSLDYVKIQKAIESGESVLGVQPVLTIENVNVDDLKF